MPDYITRSSALQAVGDIHPLDYNGLGIVDRIKSIPAADVVEVVRCCECIYHDDESQYHYCRKWRRNCPNDSDFFCKWGERKGGQDDGMDIGV